MGTSRTTPINQPSKSTTRTLRCSRPLPSNCQVHHQQLSSAQPSSGSDDSVQLLGIIPFPEPEIMCIDDEVCLDDIFPQEMIMDAPSSSHDSSIQIVANFGPIIDLVSNDPKNQDVESRVSAEGKVIHDIESGEVFQNGMTPPTQRFSRSRGF